MHGHPEVDRLLGEALGRESKLGKELYGILPADLATRLWNKVYGLAYVLVEQREEARRGERAAAVEVRRLEEALAQARADGPHAGCSECGVPVPISALTEHLQAHARVAEARRG